MSYQELRCQQCNRKLANATGKFEISIKCNRCKSLNCFKNL